MQEYELTNAQRACFGLAPVEETWERFYVKTSHFDNFAAIAYADGCTLKKLLRVSDKLYIEEEMEETISPDKETIYPKSAKGKPVKLSAAVLVKRKSRGMCLSYCVKNITLYSADNERNYYDSEMDSAGVSCFDEFVEWVNAWCADTTPDDLADVRAFAAAPRKHVKYREGDVFRFRVGRRAYGYGRILVDYPRMRRENLPFWDIFMGTALECAAYPILTPRTDVSESELAALSLLPSCVMADNRLYYGEYEIVGHIPVTDSENYAAHYGISRDFRERGQGHVILQYGKIMMNRTGVQPVPGCEHFAYNNVGFGLNVNRTILETVTAAEDNTPYWELGHRLHIENDLRNPAFADQRRAIMRQMFGASNEVST